MSDKRTPERSLDEWMELVTACRQSGLTDAVWCHEHGISPNCFYNAVSRLRKRACQMIIPGISEPRRLCRTVIFRYLIHLEKPAFLI